MLCGGLLVTTVLLSACSSDDSYDFPGDANSRVYFVNPSTLAQGAIVNTPIGYIADTGSKFSVKCTSKRTAETKVTITIDNSLVDTYNTANNTKYKAIPEGMATLDKAFLTIPADSVKSKDSISVVIPESAYKTLNDTAGYILPIVIAKTDGNKVAPSTNMGVKYMHIAISSSSIKKNAGSADMLGTLLTDYTGWTATCEQLNGDADLSIITDGNTSWDSEWEFSSNPITIQFDMQAVKNITGIRAYPEYGEDVEWGYYFKEIKLSISEDGTNWTDLGSVNNSEMADESGYQYVALYGGMKARYLKAVMNFNSEWAFSLAEFGVYVK